MALTLAQFKEQNPAYQNVSDDNLFEHFYKKYYSHMPRNVLAEQVGYEFPDKPFSSDVAEVGGALKRGMLGGFNKAAGNAIQAFSDEGSPIDEYGKSAVAYGERYEKEHPADMEGRGLIAETAIKGAEALPLMATTMLPYLAPGGAVIGPLASIALFGGDQYTQTHDKVVKAGGSEEEAYEAGLKTGAVQGLGEAVANQLGMLPFFKMGKSIFGQVADKSISDTITKATDSAVIKPFGKSLATAVTAEVGTEISQDTGTEAIERTYDVGSGLSYGEIAKEAAQATIGTFFFLGPVGLHGHYKSAERADAINMILNDPGSGTQQERLAVVDMLHKDALKNKISDANDWYVGAKADVKNDQPIRRTAALDIPDIGRAETIDEAIAAAESSVDVWSKPDFKVRPDAEAIVKNRTIPGQGLLQSIDSRYQDSGYIPAEQPWEKPVIDEAKIARNKAFYEAEQAQIQQKESELQAMENNPNITPGERKQYRKARAELEIQKRQRADDFRKGLDFNIVPYQSGSVKNTQLSSQLSGLMEATTPHGEPFNPTHELPDGTPVIQLENNVYKDIENNEIVDEYATPIKAAPHAIQEEVARENLLPSSRKPTPVSNVAGMEPGLDTGGIRANDGRLSEQQQEQISSIHVPDNGRSDALKPILTQNKTDDLTRDVNIANTGLSGFDSLPEKSRNLFNSAFAAKDVDKLTQMLHPVSKNWRGEFEKRTGIKLPKSVKDTEATVREWVKDVPEISLGNIGQDAKTESLKMDDSVRNKETPREDVAGTIETVIDTPPSNTQAAQQAEPVKSSEAETNKKEVKENPLKGIPKAFIKSLMLETDTGQKIPALELIKHNQEMIEAYQGFIACVRG